MKKTIYVFGSIEIICGLILLAVIDIMKEGFPLLGRIAFQRAMAGSYSPGDYAFSAPAATAIAAAFLAVGAIQLIVAFLYREK